jgi:outer membrane receptor protein involved in Fe transport
MKAILFISTLLISSSLIAQNGIIRGKVTDSETGESLIGAAVYLAGTSTGASADLDGNYSIENIQPGTYNLVCQFISYDADTIPGVVVEAGKVTIQNFVMGSAAFDLGLDIEITAKANRESENYMLSIQKKSARVMDGISSQQISRAGDSDAAGAVKRVTGVSVEGGKYVYVRGLSDRYSRTLLNGGTIPGVDPNRNSVPMDLFPTNLVDNIYIIKSFTPDLPADFTGGLIDINTKDFPEKFTFQVSTSLGYNTNATFNDKFIIGERTGSDWLGVSGSERDVPEIVLNNEIPRLSQFQPDLGLLGQMGTSFKNNWDPVAFTPGFNHSHGISVGNQKKIFNKTFGFNAGITYSRSYDFYDPSSDGFTGRYTLTGAGAENEILNPERELEDTQGTEEVLIGALFGGSLKLNNNNKIGLSLMHVRNGENKGRFQDGPNFSDDFEKGIQIRSQEYLERSMTTGQLSGEHLLPSANNLKITWLGTYAQSAENTPDLRVFTNSVVPTGAGDSLYIIEPGLYPVPARFFRTLDEKSYEANLNFELPVKTTGTKISVVKFGGSVLNKTRTFIQDRYDFREQNGLVFNGSTTDYFDPANGDVATLRPQNLPFFYIVDGDDLKNSYDADQIIIGAYGMVDYWLSPTFRAIAGARFESTDMELISFDPNQQRGIIDENDILPSLNLTWNYRERMNLRGAYTRTLARPTFHELAPFALFDFRDQFILVGNPNIDRTLVDNFDLRWEFFPNPGEVIAINPFFKVFTDPIEKVVNPEAQNFEIEFKNNNEAIVYGIELEARKNLGNLFKAPRLDNFSAGFNITLLQSQIQIDSTELVAIRATRPDAEDTRPMFGQSDWIINTFINYANAELGLDANVSFNVSGPKIALVTKGGTPDVYQQAIPMLDFNISKAIAEHWVVGFAAQNLLNAIDERTYSFAGRDYVFQSFRPGLTFSASVKYKL